MNLSYIYIALLFFIGMSLTIWERPQAQSAPQPSDSLELEEITVKATRLSADRRFQPVQISVIDSFEISRFAGNSVADLLETRSQLYIRNNGPGGLATVSMRGLSARQTQVLWNGFNLNHPMLGLTDLSLIPTGMVNRMEIIRGQSATAFGNGAAGGMIWLESNVKGKQAGVQHTTGSFGKSVSAANAYWQEGRWNGGVWLQYEDTDNNFDFQMNRFSNQEGRLIQLTEKRENNHLESVNVMAQAGYQADKLDIQSLLWVFDTDNQLPGGLQSLSETTRQEDSAIRWMNRAELSIGSSELKIGTMFSRQDLDFFDERSGIESVSRTRAISLDLDWQWQTMQSLRISLFSNGGHTKAETNNFNGNPTQWQFSGGVNTIWQPFVPLHIYSGIRYDYFEISGDAVSASLGANVNLVEDVLFLKTQGSRNFVAPTFNDLFWVPGGNPELEAETNYKIEGGVQLINNFGFVLTDVEVTGFGIRQHDGIRWIPDSRTGIFAPVNVDEIGSKGYEIDMSQRWDIIKPLGLTTRLGLSKTLASVRRDRFNDNRTVDKQLPQVPELSIRAGLDASFRNISAGFSYVHNSERYTTPDHGSPFDPLPGFDVSDLYAGYTFRLNPVSMNIFARVNNLFDENFQVIRNFPMPGRYFELTLKLSFTPSDD